MMTKIVIFFCVVFLMILYARGSDVIPITSQNASCANGEPILRSQFCDGIKQCTDGSDENYVGSGFKCSLTSSIQNGDRRRCVLPQSLLLDDVIDCYDATDKCFDSNQKLISSRCYRCMDGSDVISLTQVCDGTIDCRDLSDECVCVRRNRKGKRYGVVRGRNPICRNLRYSKSIKEARRFERPARRPKGGKMVKPLPQQTNNCDVGQIMCQSEGYLRTYPANRRILMSYNKNISSNDVIKVNDDVMVCVTVDRICDGVNDCPLGDDEMYCSKSNYTCSGTQSVHGNFCDGRIDCPNFDDECSSDCWLRHKYCDDVIRNNHSESYTLQCKSIYANGALSTDNITLSKDYVTAYDVCDGVTDCVNSSADEANCLTSTHYYCVEKSPVFINWTSRFDGTRHCDDGSDECVRMFNTSRDTLLRHRDALIRNPVMVTCMWIMGCMALVGNASVLHQTFSELWKDRELEKLGKLAKCNRIFVLNLAIADFLMGIYLIAIALETVITDGRYCVKDRAWRSSSMCVTLGFINQVSCQSSVFMLILMTTYRLYGTLNPFKVERSAAVQSSVIVCSFFWIIAIIIAVIPLTNVNYFSEAMWLPLPFLPADTVGERVLQESVIRANTLTYNYSGELPDLNWTSMLIFLKKMNLTSLHPDWAFENVHPFGYYNRYSICMPNLYPKRGDTAWAFAAAVVIFNFCAFCYITIAYFIIYKTSSRPAVRKSVRKRSRQWRLDNKNMQRKIFILVSTDVLCWFPICIIFALNLSGNIKVREGGAVDITGSFLLPINSAINPLIYSNAFRKLINIFREKICPKSPNKKFLPYRSFRDKVDSNSSNGSEYINKKRTTVKFAKYDDSTEYPATEVIQLSDDVRVRDDVTRTDCDERRKLSIDDQSTRPNEQFAFYKLETKNNYDAINDREDSPNINKPLLLRHNTDAMYDYDDNEPILGSMTNEIEESFKKFLQDPSSLLNIQQETML